MQPMDAQDWQESNSDPDFSDSGWIPWFCSLRGKEFFAEVEEEYIKDNFNLYGLRARFNYYDDALEMVLSEESIDEDDLVGHTLEVYNEAVCLYGLIHARYIASPRGCHVMREKHLKGTFGTCPRVKCEKQLVLPIGLSEEMHAHEVRVYCPQCEQVYTPKGKCKDLDGSSFGMYFPQIFLHSYPNLVPLKCPQPFIPRVFGFKVHKQKSLIARKNEAEEGPSKPLNGVVSATTGACDEAVPGRTAEHSDTPVCQPVVS